jgi:hypothetical protein
MSCNKIGVDKPRSLMPDNETSSAGDTSNDPNFEMPYHDAIHESNWPEYEARGFEPITDVDIEHLDAMRNIYGSHNVYTGDSFSDEEGRPLRHKPGKSMYVSPEGIRQAAEMRRERVERDRQAPPTP